MPVKAVRASSCDEDPSWEEMTVEASTKLRCGLTESRSGLMSQQGTFLIGKAYVVAPYQVVICRESFSYFSPAHTASTYSVASLFSDSFLHTSSHRVAKWRLLWTLGLCSFLTLITA